MTAEEKSTTNRAARRYALAELRRRHAEEFASLLAEKRAELRKGAKPARKTAARKPRPVKK